MRLIVIFACLSLLVVLKNVALGQDEDFQQLIASTDPIVQQQIERVYAAINRPHAAAEGNVEWFQEVQTLKSAHDDKRQLMKQLAIFVAFTTSEEDMHVLFAGKILHYLDVPTSATIHVLASHIDSDNKQLRDFARMWFLSHDSHDRTHGRPPLGSVNYHDYMKYVQNRRARNEAIPAPFIKFIYERHPSKALLVFAYANRHGDVVAQLQMIHEALEARRQGRERTPEEMRQLQESKRQDELRRQQNKERLREILLAEHTVSNAIWLKQNEFVPRFQAALPDARSQLEELAKKEWWARLYVVYIMWQHRELRLESVVQQLKDDSNELVREAAQAAPQ